MKKPLFLHEREAHADMVRLLELYRERGSLPLCVIHCFTGNKEQARKYLSMGCYIGLTGGRRRLFLTWKELPINFVCN